MSSSIRGGLPEMLAHLLNGESEESAQFFKVMRKAIEVKVNERVVVVEKDILQRIINAINKNPQDNVFKIKDLKTGDIVTFKFQSNGTIQLKTKS